jgi:lipopolysaccharide/colanic/teichoic acid biosynthesis glycosyltransferase
MRSVRRIPPATALGRVEAAQAGERPEDERALALKHALDRIAAAALIVLAAPVLGAIALALKLFSTGPVLVRDRRIDRQGQSFELLGFPAVGGLRRWSVDRMPELFNVLKGEMSFVGPRPERPEFVELFGENLRRYDQPRRVKPGITGWAQVRGLEGRAPLAERVRWDDFYVENWSLSLDLKIVLLTFRGVCRDEARA